MDQRQQNANRKIALIQAGYGILEVGPSIGSTRARYMRFRDGDEPQAEYVTEAWVNRHGLTIGEYYYVNCSDRLEEWVDNFGGACDYVWRDGAIDLAD